MSDQGPRTILVAAASRHGSTSQIAAFIAARLREKLPSDWHVQLEDADAIRTLEGHDAVVLGSAVYLGRWLRSARALLHNTEAPPPSGLWLFSSGPAADGPFDTGLVAGAVKAEIRLHARDNIVFAGDIEFDRLGPVERILTSAMLAAGGDFRKWEPIAEWADMIALELSHSAPIQHPIPSTKDTHS